MKKLFFVLNIILACCWSSSLLATSKPAHYLFAKELSLDAFQQKRLDKDQPFSDALMDGKKNVWLAGKTSLWMWESSTNRLKRIKLLSRKSDQLTSLKFNQDSLFITSNEHIFRMKFNPMKVKLFRHPKFKGGRTDRLQILSDRVLWIHNDGLVQFDSQAAKPTSFHDSDIIPAKSKSWFDEKNQTLWTADRAQITTTDFRHAPPKIKTIHRAQHAFIDIKGTDQGVLTYTNYSILKFNTAAQLNQIIPTEKGRTLLAASLTSKTHAYFFSDKLLDIFSLDRKSQQQTFLRIGGNQAIRKIILTGIHLIVLSDNAPKLFKMEANYNISRQTDTQKTSL